MITNRQKQILSCVINEHIRTAEPVSSEFLAGKYDFGICPSAIRIELQLLIKQGFLEQPHTSSGRIPTDKAYRLLVDEVLEKNREFAREKIERLIEKRIDEFSLARELTEFLADTSSLFASFNLFERNLSWFSGFDEIAREPEFADARFAQSFISFIEEFEKYFEGLEMSQGVNIYIGREISNSKAKDMSLLCSKLRFSNNENALLTLIGPKRMDYNKNIGLLNSISKIFEESL